MLAPHLRKKSNEMRLCKTAKVNRKNLPKSGKTTAGRFYRKEGSSFKYEKLNKPNNYST